MLLHHSDRGTPPDEATPDGNNSLYRFNFLTQRDYAELDIQEVSKKARAMYDAGL